MDFTRLTPQQVLDLAKPSKEYDELRKSQGSLDLDWDDESHALETLRYFVTIQEKNDKTDPDVDEETLHAVTRDGFELPLRVFRKAAAAVAKEPTGGSEPQRETHPLIVLFYGGGFILGSPTMMATLARALVKRFNAVVVAPTYRLAPEFKFPKGIEDGWDALVWLAEHATSTLKADPETGFVVGGISAGGNITNVITHLARDRGLQPPLTGNWLSVPGVRLAPKDEDKLPQKYRERNLSRDQEECIDSPIMNPGFTDLIARSNQRDHNSELCSPMVWPSPNHGEFGHKDMPRTYSQVCGADVGRDELLIYDDMLKHEGIATKVDLYVGLPHAFWTPFKQLPESKAWEERTLDGFDWLLRK